MQELQRHRQWLHTRFPVCSKTANIEAMQPKSGANLRGRRVWSKVAIEDEIPAETGGTIAFHDSNEVFVVHWDNSQTTIHHKDELLRSAFLIGSHQTLHQYIQCMSASCPKADKKIGS